MRLLPVFFVSGLVLASACRASTTESPEAVVRDAGTAPAEAPDAGAPMPEAGAPKTEDAGAQPAIGPDGGVVVSADGRARIEVPAAALATATAITIEPVAKVEIPTASGVYDFGPSGLSFAKDAQLCLEVDGTPDLTKSCLGYLSGDGKWVCEDQCLKQNGSTLCGSTNHFTNFAILLGGGKGPDATCDDALFTAAGGKLGSPDGLATLTAPAGALKATTRITIARSPDPADASTLASETFELLPDGTTFAANVELCITPKAGAKLDGTCLGYQNKDKKWVCQDVCLASKGDQLCGTTDHFTNFALLLSGGKGTSCSN